MIFLLLLFCAVTAATAHVLLAKQSTLQKKLEIYLLYLIVCTVGIGGVIGFLGHTLNYEQTARSIGWPPHKQFQFEIGVNELGWAIAGLLALVIRKPFYWLGISIAPIVMSLLAAYQHIREAVTVGNVAINNLWGGIADLAGAIMLIVLFVWYFLSRKNETS